MQRSHVARSNPPKADSRDYVLDQVESMRRLTAEGLSDDLLETRPNLILSDTASEQFRAAGYLSLLDPEGKSHDFQHAVVLALQAQTGLIRIADMPAESTVGVRLGAGTEERWIPGLDGNAPSNTIDAYLSGFWATVVARNNEIMEEIAWFPIELTRQPGARFNSYMYLWAECWQAPFRDEGHDVRRIIRALGATLPENIEFPDDDYGTLVAYPAIDLLRLVAENKPDEFNTKLAEALRDHAAFYSVPDRIHTAPSLISWPLLAVASYAADNGFAIAVESEYLPKALLERHWAAAYEPIY
ncbi:immunity 49 family protein [Nocardia lijiangensis]|uniref:immunity 49 family protein n=1 Tax=Nocardia lijiangensis TaxID=299618 RepID=UPI003D743675